MRKIDVQMKKRILCMLILFSALMAFLVFRVAYIQFMQGNVLQKKAFRQQTKDTTINPYRGTIYDRNGEILAVTLPVETLVIDPTEVRESKKTPEKISDELSQILNIEKNDILNKIQKESRYEIVIKKIEKDLGDQIRTWAIEQEIKGMYLIDDFKRYYPGNSLAAHIVGFTGEENYGLNGIEATMEEYLKGVPGKNVGLTDVSGRSLPFDPGTHVKDQDGLNVILTIDKNIQYLTQKTLKEAVDTYEVTDGAVAIVMDPRNGDILAMVSEPDFDLNHPWAPPAGVDSGTWKGYTTQDTNLLMQTVWKNKAISKTYEPGSTFKVITGAAGLEEDEISPESIVNDYPVSIADRIFNCWSTPNLHGEETFREAFYLSCNPPFVRVAQGLGIETFYKYLKGFGFYEKTGIDLPGEELGMIHKKPTEIDMASASFGQRFTITPIQLITSYTAIANSGKMMKPRIVEQLTDSEGDIVKVFNPEVIRTVISKKTSETMNNILEGVVAEGSGKNAFIEGCRVAGKTGTSETTSDGEYVSSFAGFAPADNPVICVLVVFFNPQGKSHMGGETATPVAGQIIGGILDYLNIDKR